jgi:hypothetical protein
MKIQKRIHECGKHLIDAESLAIYFCKRKLDYWTNSVSSIFPIFYDLVNGLFFKTANRCVFEM